MSAYLVGDNTYGAGGESVSLEFIIDRLTSVQVGGFWALVQVIIYAIVIYLGLVIATSLSDKRARRREGER